MSTINDVAAMAGVSASTASRALRGIPQVSARTREKVQAAALALDYVANPFAQNLANGGTDTIGLIVPYVTRWYFGQAITGAEQVVRDVGRDLLLYNLGGPEGRVRFFERLPLRNKVSGLLVLSLALEEEEIALLEQLGVPLATVGYRVEGAGSVMIDDKAAAVKATQHLVNLGHRRIALVGGELDDPMHFTSSAIRTAGYRAVLVRAGIIPDPSLECEAEYSIDGGIRAAAQILNLEQPPTAVFAMSDEIAIGIMHVARTMGVRVPEDMSVIGIDDHDLAELYGLTTIRQPVKREGARAAQLLIDAMTGPERHSPRHEILDTELIFRRSTTPPRT